MVDMYCQVKCASNTAGHLNERSVFTATSKVWGKVADVMGVPSSADCSGFVLAETKWVILHAAICDAFGFILNCNILILPFGCGSNTMAQRETGLEVSGWFDYSKGFVCMV